MVTDEIGLRDNPADKIKRPKLIAQRLEIWTPDEIASFLRQTHDHEWGEAWQMLFATIMRIGELAALRWSDVDFDEGVVTVQRTWSRTEDGVPVISDRPKTHHGRRVVPLPADVVSMLDARMHRMGGTWIWGDPPPKPATLARAWSEDVAASELPRITPHGARHSGASNMVRAGVPVGVVQRIAGHSDPAFTLRKYVHHDNDDMRDAIDTLSGLYRGETTIARVQSASRVVPMRRKHSEKSEETGF